jgi:hypothetical protein
MMTRVGKGAIQNAVGSVIVLVSAPEGEGGYWTPVEHGTAWMRMEWRWVRSSDRKMGVQGALCGVWYRPGIELWARCQQVDQIVDRKRD